MKKLTSKFKWIKTVPGIIGLGATGLGLLIGITQMSLYIKQTSEANDIIRAALFAGDKFYSLGLYDQAINNFEKALAQDPKSINAYTRLIQAYRARLESKSDDCGGYEYDIALNAQCKACFYEAEADSGMQMIYKLQALKPSLVNDRELIYEEALLSKRSGRHGITLRLLAEAHKLFPDDLRIKAELGLLQVCKAKKQPIKLEGLQLLEQVVQADSTSLKYRLYYARSLKRANLPTQAIHHYYFIAIKATGMENWIREDLRTMAISQMRSIIMYTGRKNRGIFSEELSMPLPKKLEILEYLFNHRDTTQSITYNASVPHNLHFYYAQVAQASGHSKKAEALVKSMITQTKKQHWNKLQPWLKLYMETQDSLSQMSDFTLEVQSLIIDG